MARRSKEPTTPTPLSIAAANPQAPLQIARGAIRPSIIVEGIGMFDDSPAGRKAISKIRWWHYVIGYRK